MTHTLPELGYAYDALEPYIDARTMEIHHTKHHQTYVDKLNAALEKHPVLQEVTVRELVAALDTVPGAIRTAVRNHGGGHANHTFFWSLLKKDVAPGGEVVTAINRRWGGLDQFRTEFTSTATLLFGSGWAWLVWNGHDLEIATTPNQDSPLGRDQQPILGLDVWEHAYYLKYQNRRPAYVEAFFNVINWEQVEANFKAAR